MKFIIKATFLSALLLLTSALENGFSSPFANAPEPSSITLAALNAHSGVENNPHGNDGQSPPLRSPFSSHAFSYPSFDASSTNPDTDGYFGDMSPSMGPFQKYFSGAGGNPFSQPRGGAPFGGTGGPSSQPSGLGRGAPSNGLGGARGAFPNQQQQQFGGGGFPQQRGRQPQQQFNRQLSGGFGGGAGFGGRSASSPFEGQAQGGFGGPNSGYSMYGGQQQQRGFGFF